MEEQTRSEQSDASSSRATQAQTNNLELNCNQQSSSKETIFLTEKTRLIIACFAASLALLSFIAFIITHDNSTLLGTSVLTYPLFKVIDYYFSKPNIPKECKMGRC